MSTSAPCQCCTANYPGENQYGSSAFIEKHLSGATPESISSLRPEYLAYSK
ncbi:hypothetical protein [Sinomicrobium sp. M5D2P17]